MKKLTSNCLSIVIVMLLVHLSLIQTNHAKEFLPQSTTFIGKDRFQQITHKAIAKNWRSLKIGDRMAAIAIELEGVPYNCLLYTSPSPRDS